MVVDLLEGLLAVEGAVDVEAFFGEVEAYELDDVSLVVDDQDA